MLALTRKKGESLVVNNNIEITVLEIRGDQIKIGISAPKNVPVYRKEVYLQIQKENELGCCIVCDSEDIGPAFDGGSACHACQGDLVMVSGRKPHCGFPVHRDRTVYLPGPYSV